MASFADASDGRPSDGARPLVSGHGARAIDRRGPPTAVLALGALGVVYGDLGTNPLFALGEAFAGVAHPDRRRPGGRASACSRSSSGR